MQTNRLSIATFLLALAGCLFTAPPCRAQSFHVLFDTSGLAGAAGGPFSLDFQLTDGSGTGDGNTTVTLSDFIGAALIGGPATTGGVAGALPGVMTMTDSAFFTEYTQVFTPGGVLQWDLALNMTAPEVGPTPDEWTLGLLDGMGNEIPTTAANAAFLTIDLTPNGPSIQTAGTPPGAEVVLAAPVVSAQAVVPEAGALGLFMAGLAATAFTRRFRRR